MGTVLGGDDGRVSHIYTDNSSIASPLLGEGECGWQLAAAADLPSANANGLRGGGEGEERSVPNTADVCTEPAISGALPLRVLVRIDNAAVSKARMQPLERVRCTDAPAAQPCDIYTLVTHTPTHTFGGDICQHVDRVFC